MNWRRFISHALFALAVATSSGCRREPYTVSAIPRTTATLLWEPMHLGIFEAAHGSGLRIYWNAPSDDGDTGKQLNLFAAALGRGSRGIIFAPGRSRWSA